MSQPDDEPAPHSHGPRPPEADDRREPAPPDAPAAQAEDPDASGSALNGGLDERSGGGAARGRRALGVALGILANVGAAFVILWLPPKDDVATDVPAAVLEYELAREATWPTDATLGLPLSPADERLLAATLRTHLAGHAAGEALASFDADGVAQTFADAAAVDLVHALIAWKGEVVYFDFVRHALPNGVIVRAGVLKAQRVGRVDSLHQRVFARRWVWEEAVVIYEYTLRQTDGVWKVVEVEPWGSSDADGKNVVEGGRPD